MKPLLTIALLLFIPLSTFANPMKQVAQVNPIPMFMPYLVKKAELLKLTTEQVAAFAKWRADNMAPAVEAANIITSGQHAITLATLNGDSAAKVQQLLTDVANARADLAARTLRCHEYTQSVLNESQWQQLVDLYKADINN